MSNLNLPVRTKVKETITGALRRKMADYNPETEYKPFHTRLLGRDRMHLFSFIQSLNTSFGTTIYEQVAAAIGQSRFTSIELQYRLPNEINARARSEISSIVGDLSAAVSTPDVASERQRIRKVMGESSEMVNEGNVKVDLRLADEDDVVYLIDLKTVKPNKPSIETYKRQMLNWFAKGLEEYPEADVRTAIALPYNPYYPEPYRRWTFTGMLDLENEVYVAEEFWNFLAGDDIHEDLLDCFEEVGIELCEEIDNYFDRYASKQEG